VTKDHIAFRYEVQNPLGRGSFGQVLRAIDHKTKQPVALKIIRNKKKFHEQALVEVKILKQLRGNDREDKYNVVRMIDHFLFRQHMVIVFELHGMNLYEFMKASKFQPMASSMLKKFAAQILMASAYMWRERVIHCDMKPENIVLKDNGKLSIKIIDLGSSCFDSERIYTYIQSRFYRAPEIIMGLSYGRQIDMWSVGCIVCELALGYPIFPGENEMEQMQCFAEVLGQPPVDMVEKAPRKKHFFDAQNKVKLVPNSRKKVRIPSSKSLTAMLKQNDSQFEDFLLCFLKWDPTVRVTPTEAMRHPWVADMFSTNKYSKHVHLPHIEKR